jgi:hypothetical protein
VGRPPADDGGAAVVREVAAGVDQGDVVEPDERAAVVGRCLLVDGVDLADGVHGVQVSGFRAVLFAAPAEISAARRCSAAA